ncbi:hypothetical protein [Polaromonas sp. YR568]|uniref:hypothetical protein n=1 Tax=Polaromonas sp. YR568 TaxID=1855301 RepID=UPI00398BC15A
MKAATKALLLAGCVLPLYAAAAPDGLGRLFYTAADRAEMEARRFGQPAPQEAAARALASVLRIDGIAVRPQGKTTVWINGTPYLERDLPYGVRIRRGPAGRILGVEMPLQDGEVERAAIGETLLRPLASAAAAASAPAGATKPEAAR